LHEEREQPVYQQNSNDDQDKEQKVTPSAALKPTHFLCHSDILAG
jgi:hypothetical protein